MASILEGMPCKVSMSEYVNGKRVNGKRVTEEHMATFLDLSVDYNEFESGPGHYACAVVMLENGQLATCAVDNVQILAPDEGDTNDEPDESEAMGFTQDKDSAINV